MQRKDRLIAVLEDCGFTYEEAEKIASIAGKDIIADIAAKKRMRRVRSA